MSPTQRTLKVLRDRGSKAAVVERWLRYAKREPKEGENEFSAFGKRQDLFGIIDVLSISPTETLGVQCCGSSFAEHYRKLTEEKNQESYDWLTGCCHRRLEIWSWRKVLKKRGCKVKIWQPRIVEITLDDLDI